MLTRGLLRAALVSCLVALFAPDSWGAEPGKVTKEQFTVDGQTVSYFLYVPKTVSAPAPLLLLLHGSGRDGRVLVDEWKKLADKEGIVLVGPNAQNPQAWHIPADGPAAICRLVSELHKALPVNPRRTYLFGHSAGAVFALNLAMLESEFFAAAAVSAGAWRTPDELKAATYVVRPIPVRINVGDRDRFFPVTAVDETIAALKAQQVPAECEIIRNHDHNYYAISGRINQSAWAFLVGRQLESNPKYTEHLFSR